MAAAIFQLRVDAQGHGLGQLGRQVDVAVGMAVDGVRKLRIELGCDRGDAAVIQRLPSE